MNTGEILGFAIAGFLLLIGVGIGVYVFISQLRKMEKEFAETGFYPQGYFYQRGFIYAIPIDIIIALLLLPYWSLLHKWSSILYVTPFIIPSLVIGFYQEKKNADKVRPRTEDENRFRKRSNLIAIFLWVLLIAYKLFIDKTV
jgi:hypothetical protein